MKGDTTMSLSTDSNPHLLVIASYPPQGEKHSKAIVGGAMYAKNTLEATQKASEDTMNILVLAESFQGKKESYEEDKIQIKRFWKKNSLTTFIDLTKEVLKHKKARTVVVEFELVMFGDALSLIPLPLFLFVLRILNKRVVFVFHQVLGSVAEMSGHLNLPQRGLKTSIYSFLYTSIYFLLLTFSSESIVFEQILKERLHRLNKRKKITVIPFGTEVFSPRVSKEVARERLSLPKDAYILFSFGFIAWYKGTDWLVNQFTNDQGLKTNNQLLLVIGGGPNPNHLHKPFYKKYIESVEQKSKEDGIIVTGFIEEEKMPLYFEASDIIVLPYRTLMSSSGPLSLAYSFQKPVLLSEPMAGLLKTRDMKEVFEESRLEKSDLFFPLDDSFRGSLLQKIQTKDGIKRLEEFSKRIGEERSWEKIGQEYYNVFKG